MTQLFECDVPQTLSASAIPSGTEAVTYDAFDVRLAALADRWHLHEGAGIDLRHQVGSLLNEHLGSPTTHQAYGRGITSTAATKLGTSPSEVSRMRWFASLFRTVADFHSQHPGATWTWFKAELPKLKPTNGKKPKHTSRKKTVPAEFHRIVKTLGDIRGKLSRVKDLDEAQRGKILAALRVKTLALCKEIGISVVDSTT